MTIARRIKKVEAQLPRTAPTGAEKLRVRIRNAKEAGFFVGIFGTRDDYLAAAAFAGQDDTAGAIELAETVNARSGGSAIESYSALDLTLLTEPETIELQGLARQTHPLAETAISELSALIHRALPFLAALPRA